jgi:hypothetical protein
VTDEEIQTELGWIRFNLADSSDDRTADQVLRLVEIVAEILERLEKP